MKRTIAVLTVLLAAALSTACTSTDDKPELDWPDQIANPEAFAFRAVIASTDGAPRKGTSAADMTATTLDEVWKKVGDLSAETAQALTAPPHPNEDDMALAPFASLTPAEVELLPATVAFNVPYVHCGLLAEMPRAYPDPAAETTVCDAENVKYHLRPVAIDASGLEGAKVEGDAVGGGFKIILDFTDAGTATWADLTAANVNGQVAIVLGDEVVTAPTIMAAITGGTTEVTGAFTQDEARDLVARINDALTG
ncbi:SecDF P1 head subdomain-containing protein [Phytomonospora endophytica]|uniref:SecDF P1 head subdomain domain-containing protein n=1 Tax=Phytomonospora endophytica TaxID=714109 RepID=A0A841FYL9_9ACTN|nr:hypothetical protein [Phytomonospora endophytica]MBB6038447.1 hypothetical protein [Phytomonospora endophytica]GIG64376.1 hypothetical protein Pen01_06710 [Phytomonospora endophytica]